MPILWPLAKFLFNVVGPSIPDVVKTVNTLKQQHTQTAPQGERIQEHFLNVERKLAQQLEMIESLTRQCELIHHIARKALIAGGLAIALALIAVGTVFLTR